MKEVVKRRYQRAIEEKAPLPDLLITDGGKGQMSAVKEVVDKLNLDIPIAGLAKDGKHRTSELLYGFPPQTIGLKQKLSPFPSADTDTGRGTQVCHYLPPRQAQQAAGSFGLRRDKRDWRKDKERSAKGVQKRKTNQGASAEDIVKVIGEAKAKIIKDYFTDK